MCHYSEGPFFEVPLYKIFANYLQSLTGLEEYTCELRLLNICSQTAAVFRVSTELIRNMRSQPAYPSTREKTLIRYAGKYIVAIGLWVDLNEVLQQAASGEVSIIPIYV